MLFQLLSLWVESFCVTIQMNAIEQYFHVVLFIILYKVALTFEFASEWNPMVNHSNKTTWAVLSRTMYTLCLKWNLGFIMSFDSGLLKEPIDRKQTNKSWTRLIQHTYPCDFVIAQVQSYNVMTAFQTMNRRQIVVSKRSFFQLRQTFTVYCFNLVVL